LLAMAGSIFFLPNVVRPYWPWTIAPFNAGFVGAVYLGALTATLFMIFYNRWAPARIVISMIFAFTIIILGVILTHLDQFNFQNPVTWGWIFFYIALPINCAYYLWLYRNTPPENAYPTGDGWRYFLMAFAGLLGIYGLALLITPTTASAFWPWLIDAFHGQTYSSTFVTIAVGSYLIARQAASAEWKTLGITVIVVGAASILGLLLVNGTVPLERKVNWALPGTWVWLVFMTGIIITGIAMFLQSRKVKS
jgi:hypothetical protein